MASNPRLRQAAEANVASKNRAFGPTVGQFYSPSRRSGTATNVRSGVRHNYDNHDPGMVRGSSDSNDYFEHRPRKV